MHFVPHLVIPKYNAGCSQAFASASPKSARGSGLIGDDLFAAGFRNHIDGTREPGQRAGLAGEVLPKKDALRARPSGGKRLRSLKYLRRVGKKGAIPEVGTPAFEDVD